MKVSDRGLQLVKRFEGLRLQSYRDPAGIWTIGYGTTGADVKPGMTITMTEAEARLRADVDRFERAVETMAGTTLSQGEFDALVSFCYNVGVGAFSNSTLLRELRAGNRLRAAQEFVKWIHAGGTPLLGLLRRRLAEATLFVGGDK